MEFLYRIILLIQQNDLREGDLSVFVLLHRIIDTEELLVVENNKVLLDQQTKRYIGTILNRKLQSVSRSINRLIVFGFLLKCGNHIKINRPDQIAPLNIEYKTYLR